LSAPSSSSFLASAPTRVGSGALTGNATFSLTPDKLSSTHDFTHNAQCCLRRGEGMAQQRPTHDRAWDKLPSRKVNAFLAEVNGRKEEGSMLVMTYGQVTRQKRKRGNGGICPLFLGGGGEHQTDGHMPLRWTPAANRFLIVVFWIVLLLLLSLLQVLAEVDNLPCATCSGMLRQAATRCFECPKSFVLPGNFKVTSSLPASSSSAASSQASDDPSAAPTAPSGSARLTLASALSCGPLQQLRDRVEEAERRGEDVSLTLVKEEDMLGGAGGEQAAAVEGEEDDEEVGAGALVMRRRRQEANPIEALQVEEEMLGIIPSLFEVHKTVLQVSLAIKNSTNASAAANRRGGGSGEESGSGAMLLSSSSSSSSGVDWTSRSSLPWMHHLTVLLQRLIKLESVAIFSLLPHQADDFRRTLTDLWDRYEAMIQQLLEVRSSRHMCHTHATHKHTREARRPHP
jgi:hypothetical protein